jgi:hypothetical protein
MIDATKKITDPGTIEVTASVTCNGSSYELEKSQIAKAVPNPVLGDCKLVSGYGYMLNNETITVNAPVENNYGRCTVGYTRSGTDSYPTGVISFQSAYNTTTYNTIAARATCNNLPTQTAPCPSVTVYPATAVGPTPATKLVVYDKAGCNNANPGGSFNLQTGATILEVSCRHNDDGNTMPSTLACSGTGTITLNGTNLVFDNFTSHPINGGEKITEVTRFLIQKNTGADFTCMLW